MTEMDPFAEHPETLDYYEIGAQTLVSQIIIYASPFVLFFSTLGNILTVLTLCRLCYEVWSSCVYLAIMAVLDLLVVYAWCGNDWLLELTYRNISDELLISSMSVCKVYMFSFSAIIHMQKWLMVCLTVDLYLVVKYPDKVSDWCTLSRAKAIILLLTVLMACINLHFFWTFEIINIKDMEASFNFDYFTCTWVKQGVSHSEVFENLIWPIIDISVAQILPLLIISSLTGLTLYECINGKGLSHQKEEEWRKKYMLYPNALKQLKLAVLILCVLHLLTLPKLVNNIYNKSMIELQKNNPQAGGIPNEVISVVFNHLEYTFYSLKFYILFICCRQFRAQCFKICAYLCPFCTKRNRRNSTSIAPDNSHYSTLEIRPQQDRNNVCVTSCCGSTQRNVPSHPSSRSLMASNLSSIEFHTDSESHANHTQLKYAFQKSVSKDSDNTIV